MKFTINTDNQTITILGSFLAEDFAAMMAVLPAEWQKYEFKDPIEEKIVLKEWEPLSIPYVPSNPYPFQPYSPTVPYQPYRDTSPWPITICYSYDPQKLLPSH